MLCFLLQSRCQESAAKDGMVHFQKDEALLADLLSISSVFKLR